MISSDIIVVSKYAILPGYGMSSKVFSTSHFLSKFYNVTLINSNSNHLSNLPKYKNKYNHFKYDSLRIITIDTFQYQLSKSLKRLISWFDFEIKLWRIPIKRDTAPKVVIISSLSLLTILWGLRLKKKHGTKVVFEVRDIYPLTLTDENNVSKYNPFILMMSWIEKQGYLKSDMVVGTMPGLGDHVKEVIGYERKVFYSPIGLSSYYNENCDAKIDIVIPSRYINSLIIGYSGSIGESNHLGSFVRTIKKLRDNTNFYFIILGDGDYLETFKTELHDCENVIFKGRINPSLVYEYLNKVHCLYLSVKASKVWRFGQSLNKILDYLVVGKPIIAAYSGLPNMIDEVKGNLIIPPNDDNELIKALETVRNYNQTLLEEIKVQAPKIVKEKYTYEVINESYHAMIRNLMVDKVHSN